MSAFWQTRHWSRHDTKAAFDPEPTLTGLKCRSAAVFRPAEVLVSFPSEAREALSSETARVHHPARRRGGCVAARGAGAAAGDAGDRISKCRVTRNVREPFARISYWPERRRLCRG